MKNKSQVDTTSTHDSTARMGIAAVVILVAICLATPVFINIAFQHVAPVGTLEARWTPGELLGYAGGAFSCLGTVFLGCLTLHQNRLLRDETNRRIEEADLLFVRLLTSSFESAREIELDLRYRTFRLRLLATLSYRKLSASMTRSKQNGRAIIKPSHFSTRRAPIAFKWENWTLQNSKPPIN